jgi:hypothetical protein
MDMGAIGLAAHWRGRRLTEYVDLQDLQQFGSKSSGMTGCEGAYPAPGLPWTGLHVRVEDAIPG